MTGRLAWIAVDWGTSNLRVWLLDGSGAVIATRTSDRGMNTLTPDAFEGALLDLIGDELPDDDQVSVIVCGMAGSRQGWAEAPYLTAPCPPPGLGQATSVATRDPRLAVAILPGVCQRGPADVMRGEETQIAGVLADRPGFAGVLCLPGTHTKWVEIADGEIRRFATFMTGEVFALLSEQSVLRHSVGSDGWDDAAFTTAATEGHRTPERMAAALFSLRADALLSDLDPATARARLSGLLIGAELAGAGAFWQGRPVLIAGAPGLATAYHAALTAAGADATVLDAEGITLAGLCAARAAD